MSGGLVEEEGENSKPTSTRPEVQCISKSDISKSNCVENEQCATRDADHKERASCVHESHCCCGTIRKPADQMDESTQTENSPCKHIPIPPPPPPLPLHFNAPMKIVLKDKSTVSSTHDLADNNEDIGNGKSTAGEKEFKDSTENSETLLEQSAVGYIDDTDALEEWASFFLEDHLHGNIDLDMLSNTDSYEYL